MNILLKPVITEKATTDSELKNRFTFLVDTDANKVQIKKAVETVDDCTKKVVESGLNNDYAFIIIADHGNADFAVNADGTPNTAHSTNPVPCFALNTDFEKIENNSNNLVLI